MSTQFSSLLVATKNTPVQESEKCEVRRAGSPVLNVVKDDCCIISILVSSRLRYLVSITIEGPEDRALVETESDNTETEFYPIHFGFASITSYIFIDDIVLCCKQVYVQVVPCSLAI